MRRLYFFVFLICAGGMLSSTPDVLAGSDSSNPFKEHVFVGDGIYTRLASQFTPYSGPTISASDPDIVEFERLGLVSITPNTRLNIELVTWPMSRSYVLKEATTEKLIHEFSYYGGRKASLYFSGDGTVYEYADAPPSLCWGTVSRKYRFDGDKLIEAADSKLLINTETEVLQDAKLLASPDEIDAVVTTILKGETVIVVTYKAPNQYLIKTSLGLTGWLVNMPPRNSIFIPRCE